MSTFISYSSRHLTGEEAEAWGLSDPHQVHSQRVTGLGFEPWSMCLQDPAFVNSVILKRVRQAVGWCLT